MGKGATGKAQSRTAFAEVNEVGEGDKADCGDSRLDAGREACLSRSTNRFSERLVADVMGAGAKVDLPSRTATA